jgi:hypothetical protein
MGIIYLDRYFALRPTIISELKVIWINQFHMAAPPAHRRIYRHVPKRNFGDFHARQMGRVSTAFGTAQQPRPRLSTGQISLFRFGRSSPSSGPRKNGDLTY